MKKKVLSMILATVMVMGLSVTALAAPTTMTETPAGSKNYEGYDYGDGSNLTVPITGQINRAAKQLKITTDISAVYWWVPSDANQGSDDLGGAGYNDVSATSEGGYSTTTAGNVYAPAYSVTNNSGFDVDVALYGFSTTTTDSHGQLNLNLVWGNSAPIPVVVAGADQTFATPESLGSIADTTSVSYTFGGSWTGAYQTTEIPYSQSMVLNFKAQ